MSISHKICAVCKIKKSIKEFHKNRQFKNGIHSSCKLCKHKQDRLYFKKCPWRKTAYIIKDRCTRIKNPQYKYYGARGIRCLITVDELKELWFRDKAFKMKNPSIDRIDNNGNYEFNNCRYIEWGKNSAERNTRILSKPIIQCDLQGNFIREWKNAKQVKNELNIDNGLIGNVCKGIYKQAKGFIWKYKENLNEN